MKIAVIGSGLAGLTAAWLLSMQNSVTIYEKEATLGMDSHSVDVKIKKKATQSSKAHYCETRVDLPLRVFSEQYYKNLTNLYKTTGVDISAEDYATSLSELTSNDTNICGETYFTYSNLVFWNVSIPFLNPLSLLRPSVIRILRDYFWMMLWGHKQLESGELKTITFHQYLEGHKFSADFVQKFILPALAGICTCSYESVRLYPADIIVRYLVTRSLGGVRRAAKGTSHIVDRLSQDCSVQLSTPVRSVEFVADTESLHGGYIVVEDESNCRETYDHVVIGAQANQCLKFLKNASIDQVAALKTVKYEGSSVVLHTDTDFMPKNRSEWRSVNFTVSKKTSMPMATIWMNAVQPSLNSEVDIFQTWNPFKNPKNGTTLGMGEFERPVVTLESVQGMELLKKKQGENNIWFCGSYVPYGMPLLESAVESAVLVAKSLGTSPPWTIPNNSESSFSGGNLLILMIVFCFLIGLVTFVCSSYYS